MDTNVHSRPQAVSDGVARELERSLTEGLRGEVRFDQATRAMYATDASNYRQVPIGVVTPCDADDLMRAVAICRDHGAPIVARGGGTSLAGQCCNVAVVLDCSRHLCHVLSVDPERRLARVQPGANLDALRREAARHGLTFGPDPSTHDHNTLGGMIGNNSCGAHSVMAELFGPGPLTVDNVAELEVLTYDGLRMTVGPTSAQQFERIREEGGRRAEIYEGLAAIAERCAPLIRERYPEIPRRVSGYNLDRLLPEHGFDVAGALVGSEGTCVTVLSATLKLMPNPSARVMVVLGYPDVYSAADHVGEVMAMRPIGLEGIDDKLIGFMREKHMRADDVALLPDGGGWLLAEFGGDCAEDAAAHAQALVERLRELPDAPAMRVFDEDGTRRIWEIREAGLGATAHVPGMRDTYPGWEDAAVPPARLGGYLREFRALLDEFGYDCSLYGHFGQGCVHCRIDFELGSDAGVRHMMAFIDRAADLVVSYGGSLSGEHGDGQARAALLPKMVGTELIDTYREFKRLWDPVNRMNPGKVVDAYDPDENLRLGPDYRRGVERPLHFSFRRDDGSFAAAAERCVGVGKCRRMDGGTMCPSYMGTREERYSTRGRARLLFEMMRGDAMSNGWDDTTVFDALDWCLACKGCRNDCPVEVDMATYKAEFMAHYYANRRRPRHALAMGWIHWWARAASVAPRLVNALTARESVASVGRRVAGISRHRQLPRFAEEPFTKWFRRRDVWHPSGERVLLWPDTFGNYLRPEPLRAATRVLEDAGYVVTLPGRPLCCGRPLYDIGMIDVARRLWLKTFDVLEKEIAAGTPVIGLEPSCVAAFRDELPNMFPDDERAGRLQAQTRTLAEFLDERGYEPAGLGTAAIVHRHCHERSVLGTAAGSRLLAAMDIDELVPEPGCCGMAGAFGFTEDKAEVSLRIAERALLPALRDPGAPDLLIADGYSCYEQIRQTTGRDALHLAQVLERACLENTRADDSSPREVAAGETSKRDEAPPTTPSGGR
ncbi:MAG: FAD-binding and (Fe-S)-binding domain-containing protein [Burkholderiaceae bacterium]